MGHTCLQRVKIDTIAGMGKAYCLVEEGFQCALNHMVTSFKAQWSEEGICADLVWDNSAT